MTTREIQAPLLMIHQQKELYGKNSTARRSLRRLISNVTSAVLDEVTAWQVRPLESIHLIGYLDTLFVKVRDAERGGHVAKKAVYAQKSWNQPQW